jgi:hypothetical protein
MRVCCAAAKPHFFIKAHSHLKKDIQTPSLSGSGHTWCSSKRFRWLIPPKTSLIHKIFGHIDEKKKKKRSHFFAFVNPNLRRWIFLPTKEILIPVSGSK